MLVKDMKISTAHSGFKIIYVSKEETNINELKHYGVLGMKWGVRKQRREYLKKGKKYGKAMNKLAGEEAQKSYEVGYHKRMQKKYSDKITKAYLKAAGKTIKRQNKTGDTSPETRIAIYSKRMQKKVDKWAAKYEAASKGEQKAIKEWNKTTKRLYSLGEKAAKKGYKYKIKDVNRRVRAIGEDAVKNVITDIATMTVVNTGLRLAGQPWVYVSNTQPYVKGKKIKFDKKATVRNT